MSEQNLKRWSVTVVRKQSWLFDEIYAATAEEAKAAGDRQAMSERPDDDWAYETIAREQQHDRPA